MKTTTLRAETRGDVSVLHVGERLTLGNGDEALSDAIKALIAGGTPKVVLDLSSTSHIDSAGVGALVSAFTSVTSAGGRLALAGATKRVSDLLRITKLDSVFPMY